MDVKFIETTSSKLSGLSIQNGQLIALSDKNSLLYDLGGVRHHAITISDNVSESAGTAASGVAASSYALVQLNNATNSISYGYLTPNSSYIDTADCTMTYFRIGKVVKIEGHFTLTKMAYWNQYIPLFTGCPAARNAANPGGWAINCSNPTNGSYLLTLHNNYTHLEAHTLNSIPAGRYGVEGVYFSW